MCGGEPRAMLRKDRGKADSPIYSIQICVPKHGNMILSILNAHTIHKCLRNVILSNSPSIKTYNYLVSYSNFSFLGVALNLIFSFTNGEDWDGPYRLQFRVPKTLQNKPIEFFNEVQFL